MFQKKWALLTLSSLSLLMVACEDGENLESMQEAVSELDRIKNDAIQGLNQLVDGENQLQSQFNETMETDADLTTFKDGSAPVFENIETRQTVLTELDKIEDELETHEDVLGEYEGELLEQADVDVVLSNVDAFTDQLDSYREAYANTLASQEAYFTSLPNDDTDYDVFVEGITTLNDERDSLKEHVLTLDTTLIELDESLADLQTTIDTLLTEEE